MIWDDDPATYHYPKKSIKWESVEVGGRGRISAGSAQVPRARVPRKKTFNVRAVMEVLDFEGLNPTEEVLKLLRSGELEDRQRIAVWMGLLEYTQPKLKATTITVNNRPMGELTEAELRELAGIIDQGASGTGTPGEAGGTVIPFRLRAADEPVSDAIETPRLPTE